MTPENKILDEFTTSYNLGNLIKEPTCFKSSPSCIDLILTNQKQFFKNSTTFITGVS